MSVSKYGCNIRPIKTVLRPDLPGDVNRDGTVDTADAGLLFENWGGAGIRDLTDDNILDAADAGVLFANWTGNAVPAGLLTFAPAAATSPVSPAMACHLRARQVDTVMNDNIDSDESPSLLGVDYLKVSIAT